MTNGAICRDASKLAASPGLRAGQISRLAGRSPRSGRKTGFAGVIALADPSGAGPAATVGQPDAPVTATPPPRLGRRGDRRARSGFTDSVRSLHGRPCPQRRPSTRAIIGTQPTRVPDASPRAADPACPGKGPAGAVRVVPPPNDTPPMPARPPARAAAAPRLATSCGRRLAAPSGPPGPENRLGRVLLGSGIATAASRVIAAEMWRASCVLLWLDAQAATVHLHHNRVPRRPRWDLASALSGRVEPLRTENQPTAKDVSSIRPG